MNSRQRILAALSIESKRQYGDRLSFWGTISVQTTLPFGTPDDVRATVRRMIEQVGRGGGFIIGPCHYIQEDTPWENVAALFDAIAEFGSCFYNGLY